MGFWKNKPLVITVVLILVLVILLFVTSTSTQMGQGESIVGAVLTPVQGFMNSTANSIGSFFGRVFSTSDESKQIQELEEKVAQLEAQLMDLDKIKAENGRLTELLNVKDIVQDDAKIVTARIIGKNPGQWFTSMTVNVGKNDGIEPGMPIVTNKGLVGRVTQCANTYSKILTIMDSKSGVSTIVERTRATGIVKGNATDNIKGVLSMEYLVDNADILPGDKIITSGLGGVYPKGIPVGDMVEVVKNAAETGYIATVKPFVDFSKLEEVIVIKKVYARVEE